MMLMLIMIQMRRTNASARRRRHRHHFGWIREEIAELFGWRIGSIVRRIANSWRWRRNLHELVVLEEHVLVFDRVIVIITICIIIEAQFVVCRKQLCANIVNIVVLVCISAGQMHEFVLKLRYLL